MDGTRYDPGRQGNATEPRRLRPRPGQALTMADVRGIWRPSGVAGGVGVFAVVWSISSGDHRAAMHDFSAADELRLIDACRQSDHQANGPPGSQVWGC